MKTNRKLAVVLILLALLLLPARPAGARGLLDGQVIFGGEFTLKSGETLDDDLVVLGGVVTLEEGSRVSGDIVVVGGSLTVGGEIEGDVVVVGGLVSLGETAVVSGDLAAVGGRVERAPGAQVEGEVFVGMPIPTIEIPEFPSMPVTPAVFVRSGPFDEFFRITFNAVALALLAMLLSLFLTPHFERVAQATVSSPLVTGSVGLLTIALAPLAAVILVVTVILIPVAVLVVFGVVLAWLFGFIALGLEVGERFTAMIHREWAPALKAGFGTLLLMFGLGLIGLIDCLGVLAHALIAMIGIGSVVLTMFGSRPYPPPVLPAPGAGEPVG